MKYEITINKTETAKSESLKAITAFLKSVEDVKKWTLDFVQNGKKMNLAASGLNCIAEFNECLNVYRMGR